MSQPFLGEIRMFAGTFAPAGWASCDGQLLAVSQNDALFSLLGTIYGGDGETTFGLPDLRGRIPVHFGQGPGLASRPLGVKFGQEQVTVTAQQVPAHAHTLRGVTAPGATPDPAGNRLAAPPSRLYADQAPDADMLTGAVEPGGGAQPHDNMMPVLAIRFIIALFGVYPS